MNIVQRMLDRFQKRQEEKVGEALQPYQYNRAGRRALGFRGPVDPDWVQHEATFFVPRYVRRHYRGKVAAISPARPRGARKARARILRAFARIGNQPTAGLGLR